MARLSHIFLKEVRRRGFDQIWVRRALVPQVKLVLLQVQLEMILEPNREERDNTVAPVARPNQNLCRRFPLFVCIFVQQSLAVIP